MSEIRERNAIGMSAGAWISFGSLLIGLFLSGAAAVYWAGNHNAAQEQQGRDIQRLLDSDRSPTGASATANRLATLEREVGEAKAAAETAARVADQLRVELARATGK